MNLHIQIGFSFMFIRRRRLMSLRISIPQTVSAKRTHTEHKYVSERVNENTAQHVQHKGDNVNAKHNEIQQKSEL